MAVHGVNPKCYILALFVRDDEERFLLGDGPYEFKDKQLHFQPNTVANDVVEVQGNDGYLLAGQVRRPGVQAFDGYVGMGTTDKATVETQRRAFFQFFRRGHFYKVIYVFPNGTAIQRKQGFLVDDPTVQELYQQYPEYHVALNFEDVNYYTYSEDSEGHEIYAKEAIIKLTGGGARGGLIWDAVGVVWEDSQWGGEEIAEGSDIQINNQTDTRVAIRDTQLNGDTYQQTYSGKNLWNMASMTSTSSNVTITGPASDGEYSLTWTGGFAAVLSSISGLNSQTSYTVSFKHKGEAVTLRKVGTSTPLVYTERDTNYTSYSYTFTGETSLNLEFLRRSATTNVTAYIKDFQLETGSTATSYEPYVGGIPAPNPDYPQAVQVVTGEQTVEVTGKNLFDKNTVTLYAGYFSGAGEIRGSNLTDLTVSADRFFYIPCESNTTYTITKPVQATTSLNRFRIGTQSSLNISDHAALNDFWNAGDGSTTTTHTITTGANAKYLFVYFAKATTATDPGGGIQEVLDGLQIEKSSTATAYEPYQGQTYTIDLRGKNLLNISDFAMGGLSNGNPTTSSYRIQNANHPIAVQPNTTYTLSAQLVSPVQGFRVGVHECNINGVFISDSGWKQLYVPNTFTTGPNTRYLKMVGSLSTTSTNVSTGGTENTTACSTVVEFMRGCTLMLEKGSPASAYQPYNPIELCKIGDYQDYIYKSGDDWYVHKETGKAVFDGDQTETWKQSGAYNAIHNIQLADILPADNNNRPYQSKIYCDHFTLSDSGYNGGYLYPSQNGKTAVTSDKYLSFNYSQTTSIVTWTTWLSSNNVSAYYPLATPTDTKITDATLISQLDALGDTKLYVGQNNILVSAPSPDLPALLHFKYYTTLSNTGAEWEEGGTSGATIVEVDAIDNTYPIWELVGPSVNPTLSVLTTNTTLTYNGTLSSSQKLVIDMFNKTATLNGTSVIGNVTGDWVYMAPGTNRVAYTASNTDAPDSTVYWQEVVG